MVRAAACSGIPNTLHFWYIFFSFVISAPHIPRARARALEFNVVEACHAASLPVCRCKFHVYGSNLYQKLSILAILGAVSPHFKNSFLDHWVKTIPAWLRFSQANFAILEPISLWKPNGKIWRDGAVPGLPPHPKCCKNRVKGLAP